MRYFEFHNPYYALIKARNTNESYRFYDKVVADLDEETICTEISKFEAFAKFGKITTEYLKRTTGEKYTFKQCLEEFEDEDNILLIIDGGLI